MVGNIFDENIISNHDYWNLFEKSDYHPSFCKECGSIGRCDCGCREVANIIKSDPREIDVSIKLT